MEKPDTVVEYSSFSTAGSRPLTGVLQNTIFSMGSAARIRQSMALAYWERVVGPQAAAASFAESIRDSTLIVQTRSSVWSHELTMHKAQILIGLNRLLGTKMIDDIIFRAQGVPPKPEPEPEDTPSLEILDAVVLQPFEKEELDGLLTEMLEIKDDRIRNAVTTRVIREAKLRHWRLERGWHVCFQCNVAHKTEDDLCPICRLGPR